MQDGVVEKANLVGNFAVLRFVCRRERWVRSKTFIRSKKFGILAFQALDMDSLVTPRQKGGPRNPDTSEDHDENTIDGSL